MNTIFRIINIIVIVISVVALSTICWHSIEEIHYLKSFFPKQFSAEEAMYASIVELIKIKRLLLLRLTGSGIGGGYATSPDGKRESQEDRYH